MEMFCSLAFILVSGQKLAASSMSCIEFSGGDRRQDFILKKEVLKKKKKKKEVFFPLQLPFLGQ